MDCAMAMAKVSASCRGQESEGCQKYTPQCDNGCTIRFVPNSDSNRARSLESGVPGYSRVTPDEMPLIRFEWDFNHFHDSSTVSGVSPGWIK